MLMETKKQLILQGALQPVSSEAWARGTAGPRAPAIRTTGPVHLSRQVSSTRLRGCPWKRATSSRAQQGHPEVQALRFGG